MLGQVGYQSHIREESAGSVLALVSDPHRPLECCICGISIQFSSLHSLGTTYNTQ